MSTWRTRRFRTLASVVLAVGALLATWAFWVEPRSLRVETHVIRPRGWPATCDGLTVAVLSDLHVGAPGVGLEKLARIVEETNARRPDMVLLAGDYVIHGVVGGRFVEPEAIADGLSALHAPGGVYAVLGNHDNWLDGPRIARVFERAGIRVLEDRHATVEAGHCSLSIIGLGDFTTTRHDLDAALRGVSRETANLLLTHDPDVFPEVPPVVHLAIAGHTHGGQVRLPLVGRPIVPSRYGERYAAGHVVEGGRDLFVTTGVGTSILPVRFRVPPAVSILTLVAGEDR